MKRNELKRKIGDIVYLNERFDECDRNKPATIHSIEEDKKGNCFYRLMYKNILDPYDWSDSDFK